MATCDSSVHMCLWFLLVMLFVMFSPSMLRSTGRQHVCLAVLEQGFMKACTYLGVGIKVKTVCFS